MKIVKILPGPLSPVEFAINKAQYFIELTQCDCKSCKKKLSGLREETKALARTINRIRQGSPALCFVAMFEEWTIEKLLDEVNKAVTPATEWKPQQ
jgi:hypothetical protein